MCSASLSKLLTKGFKVNKSFHRQIFFFPQNFLEIKTGVLPGGTPGSVVI